MSYSGVDVGRSGGSATTVDQTHSAQDVAGSFGTRGGIERRLSDIVDVVREVGAVVFTRGAELIARRHGQLLGSQVFRVRGRSTWGFGSHW